MGEKIGNMEINSNQLKNNRFQLGVIFGLGILSMLVGYILTPNVQEIMSGLWKLIIFHHRIDSELMSVAGNWGSVFVNAGILIILMGVTFVIFKTNIKGAEWGAVGQIFGYAFYAESLFNVWPTIIGVMIEAKVSGKDMGDQVYVAWFSSALAPFVSMFAFHVGFLNPGSPLALAFGITLGLILGYLVGKASGYIRTLHRGRLLFNIGFTTGVTGWFMHNFLKGSGFVFEAVSDQTYLTGVNNKLFMIFMIFNLYFFIAGMVYNKGFGSYFKDLFWGRTDGGNYVADFGVGNTLMNIGVLGTAAFLYMFATAAVTGLQGELLGQINGPIIGGIYTVAGFAACGVTLRSVLPVWLGIWLGSFIFGGLSGYVGGTGFIAGAFAKMGGRPMGVAAMHCVGISPTAERDGWWVTTIIAMIHTVNVVNTGALNGWMQSYNNGFSQGLIITLFYPFWSKFSKLRKTSDELIV